MVSVDETQKLMNIDILNLAGNFHRIKTFVYMNTDRYRGTTNRVLESFIYGRDINYTINNIKNRMNVSKSIFSKYM